MTTVASPQGLLLVWTSFLTGLFLAYCACSVERFVTARIRAALPPPRPIVVEKIYEQRASREAPRQAPDQGG